MSISAVSACTSFISLRTQVLFRTFFYWLGTHIHRKPWLFILIGVFITLCCSLGGLLFNEEVRNFYLWVPQESDIWAKFENVQQEYGISPKMTLLLSMNDESESILSPKNMNITFNIFNEINNIKLGKLNYSTLCLRPHPTSPYCASDYSNIFEVFFGSNPLLWQNNSNTYKTINTGGASFAIYGFAGGIKRDDMQLIYSANVLLFIYELKGSINKTEHDIIYEYMGAFQDYWSIHKNDYSEMNIEYATQRSLDDEVSRVIIGDFHIMVIALTVMLLYLMITLGPFSCIESRPWLAVSAILVLICSMTIGFGISFLFGTTFNIICILSAYILLGVGVDDMIIIVDTYERITGDEEVRLAKTLSESGLAISLTSLCSSMAFFVGSTTDLPAISAFCTFAAWSFLANYILQFLIFVPLMVYEDQRIAKGNNFCCPCCIHHEQSNFAHVTIQSLSEAERKRDEKAKGDKNKFSMTYYVMKICVIPLLTKRFCRWIIIFIFITLFYGSIYVSFFIDTKFDDTKLVPDDSFMIDYIETYDENFCDILITDLNIIIENQDFSDVNVRNNVYDFINAVENHPNAIGEVHHWLNAFANFTIKAMNLTHLNDLNDSKVFYEYLNRFCNDNNQWHSEIFYNDFYVTSTRFFLTVSKSADRSDQWEESLHWNAICEEYFGSECYVFEPEYTFAYLVSHIQGITINNMIYAAYGVFGILLFFLDFRVAVFCLLMIAIIDVNLFGWMWLLNISLDVVSYTELVMAAGLTVDYVIHIVHAVIEHENDDDSYEEKIKSLLLTMGSSVLKGGFTTFLGAVALVFSHSEAFRIFLFMFMGIIIIALAVSILVVPSLLGEFKFIYKGIPNSNTKYYTAVHNTNTSMTNISKSLIEFTMPPGHIRIDRIANINNFTSPISPTEEQSQSDNEQQNDEEFDNELQNFEAFI